MTLPAKDGNKYGEESVFVSVRYHLNPFFWSVCAACGWYAPAAAFEERRNGLMLCEDRYCARCQHLAGTEVPLLHRCDCCGRIRDARLYRCCICGCSSIRPVPVITTFSVPEPEKSSLPPADPDIKPVPTDSEGKIKFREFF